MVRICTISRYTNLTLVQSVLTEAVNSKFPALPRHYLTFILLSETALRIDSVSRNTAKISETVGS
jgi:hypothetical protein